jgi:transcriptional regulator with GAF, ATPase, and Fis domain
MQTSSQGVLPDNNGVASNPTTGSLYRHLHGRGVTLCEPDDRRRRELVRALAKDGLHPVEAPDWRALQRLCDEGMAPVIAVPLLRCAVPSTGREEIDGEFLAFLRAEGRRRDVVVYTDTTAIPMGVYCRALTAGARRILNDQSPNFTAELAATLTRLLSDRQARAEEETQLTAVFAEHGLIGTSPALREVFRRALKASNFSDLPVLLLGATGTGKQQLAEAIHRLDKKRCDKPFVTVNCSAISRSLAESELFGHVKGAFSGADADRAGLLRAAEGGTLLLDEIGDLDRQLQPKLLRVLQERRLLPVGQDYEHAIDVRIIAATNRPLRKMVEKGHFRADLYQRLNVFRIVVPPLRERREDVEVQARYFLKLWTESHGRAIDFGPRVLEALRELPWEGNSRQLRNFLWEALAHKDGGELLEMEDLPDWVLEALSSGEISAEKPLTDAPAQRILEDGLSLSEAVCQYERRLLRQVLEQNNGNRTRTAAKLGLTPRSVFNKIKKHGLD